MKKEETKEQYKEWLEETANKNRNNPNHSEQAFIDMLDYFDIKYTFQKPVIYDNKDGYIYDFYMKIDGKEYDIEIDGKSHMSELTKLKDFKRDVQAKDYNINVIRLDSYFVLFLRNIFKEEFTKESFLKWIINECPINLKKDMSEYKEKELELDIELDLEKDISIIQNILNNIDNKKYNKIKLKITYNNTKEEERKGNDDLDSMFHFDKKQGGDRRDNLASEIFAKYKAKHWSKYKNKSTSTSSNYSSTVETSNNQEELPF